MKLTTLTTHNSRTWRKMNWSDTNAIQSLSYRKKIHLPLVACLMLFWMYSMPMVSCRRMLDIVDNDDGVQNQENSLMGKHNNNILNKNHNEIHSTQQNRKNSSNSMHPLDEWSLGVITNGRDNDEQISKKVKEKIRRRYKNKNKYNKDKLHKDYDETFQKLQRMRNSDSRGDFRYIESDKKYFDYFPIEKIELNSNETEADDNIKVIFLLNDEDTNGNNKKQHRKKWKKIFDDTANKRHSHIRSRRSAPINPSQLDNPIQKRNIESNGYIENVLGIQQGNIVPRTNLIRKNRDEVSVAEENGRYYSYGTINDPWNNRLTKPFNSFQLPVQNARILTAVPLVKYPIPGIYYNPISPPGNQPGRKIPTDDDIPSIGNRFGDDRVIWDIQYTRRPVSAPKRPINAATRRPPVESATQSSTRRTPPPLIRNPSRDAVTQRPTVSSFPLQNSNSFLNEENTLSSSSGANGRIPPPLFHSPSRDAVTQFGITTTTMTTTRRPSVVAAGFPTRRPEPSKCVWAIVSCCSRDNLTVRYSCFEQIGCHGAFWDLNPCADDIQEAALAEAEKYFD